MWHLLFDMGRQHALLRLIRPFSARDIRHIVFKVHQISVKPIFESKKLGAEVLQGSPKNQTSLFIEDTVQSVKLDNAQCARVVLPAQIRITRALHGRCAVFGRKIRCFSGFQEPTFHLFTSSLASTVYQFNRYIRLINIFIKIFGRMVNTRRSHAELYRK